VLLFAGLADAAGKDTFEMTLPDNATVGDLRTLAIQVMPSLSGSAFRVAMDAVYATDDSPLTDSAEVAFIPPVSGG